MKPLPAAILRHRDRACAACLTPCALRDAHSGACDHCPLSPPAWPEWECNGSSAQHSTGLGDQVERYAKPVARAIDRATRGATQLEKCGGCQSAKADLNYGRRSDEPGRPVV